MATLQLFFIWSKTSRFRFAGTISFWKSIGQFSRLLPFLWTGLPKTKKKAFAPRATSACLTSDPLGVYGAARSWGLRFTCLVAFYKNEAKSRCLCWFPAWYLGGTVLFLINTTN
jgi:hypothetical protein